ncbi:MAG: flagellar basal body rod protein FlgC [Vulcanimicrobiaceae bacterium]
MGFYTSIQISASGLSAERLAMDVIANNIANVNTTRTPQGGPFRCQLVVFASKPNEAGKAGGMFASPFAKQGEGSGGVEVLGIVQDPSPDRLVFDPSNPAADARGYVHYPNIQVVKEMVDMMAASRAYQADVAAIHDASTMSSKTLQILQA